MTKASGWLIIDKPLNVTSFDVVAKIRRFFKPSKVGHAGTLDPLASGVLVIAVGEATKLIDMVMDCEKEYVFDIRWGADTATLDSEGDVVKESKIRPSKNEIECLLNSYKKQYKQIPPKFSAIKVDGKRAYDLARKGVDFELEARAANLIEYEIIEHSSDYTRIKIVCGKGFYVRSLAQDIAHELGSCGHVSYLRRTRVGKFSENDAITLDNLLKILHNYNTSNCAFELKPILSVLDDILVQEVPQSMADRLKTGLTVQALDNMPETMVAICDGHPVAICSNFEGVLKVKRGFNL